MKDIKKFKNEQGDEFIYIKYYHDTYKMYIDALRFLIAYKQIFKVGTYSVYDFIFEVDDEDEDNITDLRDEVLNLGGSSDGFNYFLNQESFRGELCIKSIKDRRYNRDKEPLDFKNLLLKLNMLNRNNVEAVRIGDSLFATKDLKHNKQAGLLYDGVLQSGVNFDAFKFLYIETLKCDTELNNKLACLIENVVDCKLDINKCNIVILKTLKNTELSVDNCESLSIPGGMCGVCNITLGKNVESANINIDTLSFQSVINLYFKCRISNVEWVITSDKLSLVLILSDDSIVSDGDVYYLMNILKYNDIEVLIKCSDKVNNILNSSGFRVFKEGYDGKIDVVIEEGL